MYMNELKKLFKRLEGFSKLDDKSSESWFKYTRRTISEIREALDWLEAEITEREQRSNSPVDHWTSTADNAIKTDEEQYW